MPKLIMGDTELAVAPFPHPGACPYCRTEKRCNHCGDFFLMHANYHCTNGRCRHCHDDVCTPGGATSNGHAFGHVGTTEHFVPADTPGSEGIFDRLAKK